MHYPIKATAAVLGVAILSGCTSPGGPTNPEQYPASPDVLTESPFVAPDTPATPDPYEGLATRLPECDPDLQAELTIGNPGFDYDEYSKALADPEARIGSLYENARLIEGSMQEIAAATGHSSGTLHTPGSETYFNYSQTSEGDTTTITMQEIHGELNCIVSGVALTSVNNGYGQLPSSMEYYGATDYQVIFSNPTSGVVVNGETPTAEVTEDAARTVDQLLNHLLPPTLPPQVLAA